MAYRRPSFGGWHTDGPWRVYAKVVVLDRWRKRSARRAELIISICTEVWNAC